MTRLDKTIFTLLLLFSGLNCSNTISDKNAVTKTLNQSIPDISVDSVLDIERATTINNYFYKRYKMNIFSGAFLFYDSGKYFSNSFGYANGRLRTKLRDDMPFQIASVSKTLTAYTILSLIDQGRLKINMPIEDIFEDFPYKNITLDHLLSHKSGIPNYMNFAELYWKNKRTHLTNADVLWMLKRYHPRLEFRPNQRYKYSNTNYVLLALIVEKITNIPFESYMKDSIFGVIGMKNSFVFSPDMSLRYQPVQGHSNTYNIFQFNYQNGTMGDKGVYTTIFDLLKFDKAVRSNILISSNTLKNACTPHTACRPTKDYYGYGWRIRYYDNNDTIIYHNGWWQGFKAYFIRWKNKDRCIIVLTNTIKGGFIKQDELISLMEGKKPKAVTAR
ncbi:MAG: beta-lactamase family protein [Bacteroidetes bacterium]|nr:beta-lactamase family protein [Bacteroidota bacterium]